MLYRSETFEGTWPMGIHWTPGEVRDVPASAVSDDDPTPPAGLHAHVQKLAAPPAPSTASKAKAAP